MLLQTAKVVKKLTSDDSCVCICPYAVLSSCVHNTGHSDTHRHAIILLSNMLSPCHRFPLKINDELVPAENRHTPNYCTGLVYGTHRPTEYAQTQTTDREGGKNPVSPERLTPWSALDLHLSSKGRISVRLRSESKGKRPIGIRDEFYPSTTR